MKAKGLVAAGAAGILGVSMVLGLITARHQSRQIEQLLRDFSREQAAHDEEDRRRWENYLKAANDSRVRIEEMAKGIRQLQGREEEIRLAIRRVAEQSKKDELRLAGEDLRHIAESIEETAGLTASPMEKDGGLFFSLPLSRELAIFSVSSRTDQVELNLKRQESQNLHNQLSTKESECAELQEMVKTAEAALTSERTVRQHEAGECRKAVKSLAKVARKGFWRKVWDRTKVVLAFGAGAIAGRLMR